VTWGKSCRTVSADDSVQSELEAFLVGVGAGAAGVADLAPESLDPDVLDDFESEDFDSDDFDSEDFESDDDDSVDVVLDDDFDFPLRLSVL
jgi:protein-tyrosine-phosphatase